jgi:hypothetical protein
MKINKIESIIREILIYPFAIVLFPFLTIRSLVWNWFFWLVKSEMRIKKYNNKI